MDFLFLGLRLGRRRLDWDWNGNEKGKIVREINGNELNCSFGFSDTCTSIESFISHLRIDFSCMWYTYIDWCCLTDTKYT